MGGEYQPLLVLLSVLIAVLAGYTALDLARTVSSKGPARAAWLAGGSIALGIGIWSMHFVGMLAFRIPGLTISYQTGPMLASFLIAIAASALAMHTVTRSPSTRAFIAAGLAMGVAIAGMHYTGMAAIHAPAHIAWNYLLVAASIAIAVAASFGALWLALRVRRFEPQRVRWTKLGGAVVMGFAIAGMHYTAMAASTFIRNTHVPIVPSESIVATRMLATLVAVGTLLVFAIAIFGAQLSARQQMQRRLKESEEYYRSILEQSSDLIVVIDEKGRRKYTSPTYTRLLGREPGELIGGDAFSFIHPDDLDNARAFFAHLIEHPGGRAVVEVRIQHAEGKWVTFRSSGHNLLHNPAVRGVVISARDETDRLQLEEQFRQSQKMEAVGRLAGGIAHDFNNLLTVIEGNVDLLADDPEATPSIRIGLEQIGEAAERAAVLTRQLLAFSRRQILQPRSLDLNDIPRGMQGMLIRLLGEDITVKADLSSAVLPVRADPNQIEQVIMNLAVNARDSMPKGGTITIRTRTTRTIGRDFRASDPVVPGLYAALEVSDTGCGIDSETLERIFEPFFTTKEQGKGTGLGLATVYGIMKQSGGHVAVRSTPGTGTTFMLLFPIFAQAELPLIAVNRAAPATSGSETILLIEDEAALRTLVRRVLERKGYRVIAAENGETAIAWSRSYEDTIDLVIADVVLPGMNGREAVEQLLPRWPQLRVLYISGYNEDEILHRGVMRDQTHFLEKPFTPASLLQKVRAVLNADVRARSHSELDAPFADNGRSREDHRPSSGVTRARA